MADTAAVPSTKPQTTLADYCLWHEIGQRPCYAPAEFVLVRPSGETLGFSCAAHRDQWDSQIRGTYLIVDLAEWRAQGSGYRGRMLGG